MCKTRLWADPLFFSSKLCCPRCGTEFQATVPWMYVRILLAVVVILAFVVVSLVSQGNLMLLLILLVVLLVIWFLPRIIQFESIGPELTPSEGTLDPQDWKQCLEDQQSVEDGRDEGMRRRVNKMIVSLLVTCLVLSLIIAWVRLG